MLLHLISDVHVNFYTDKGDSLIENVASTDGADVLIMAGDIADGRFPAQFKKLFEAFSPLYRHVIVVTGNHEYYKCRRDWAHHSIAEAAGAFNNVHHLDASSVVIDGRTFHGHTMWYRDSPLARAGEPFFSDFQWIGDWSAKNRWMYAECERWEKYLVDNLREGDVVVTHHMPSNLSVGPQWINAKSNCFFVCDMEELMLERKPALWVHGHTHDPFDYTLGDTRVVCEPRGYPRERAGWQNYKPKEIVI